VALRLPHIVLSNERSTQHMREAFQALLLALGNLVGTVLFFGLAVCIGAVVPDQGFFMGLVAVIVCAVLSFAAVAAFLLFLVLGLSTVVLCARVALEQDREERQEASLTQGGSVPC
jgi:hypothetical protein